MWFESNGFARFGDFRKAVTYVTHTKLSRGLRPNRTAKLRGQMTGQLEDTAGPSSPDIENLPFSLGIVQC